MITTNKCMVYGFRNIENGMMNIGYKSSQTDRPDYISSISNEDFWKEYYLGKMNKVTLFEGSSSQDDLAKTLEWFALEYGMSYNKDMFYNRKNNAHCVNESLMSEEQKQIIVDWIEGNGSGVKRKDRYSSDREIVTEIWDKIVSGKFPTSLVSVPIIYAYERNQIRIEQIDQHHVTKIKSRFDQNPKESWELLLKNPVTVVVKIKNGITTYSVLNGNNRLEAVSKTSLEEIPVVYINESEFGDTEKIRNANYELFGLVANKEDFEVRKPNTDGDLKKNIINFLVGEEINLSDPLGIENGRYLVYDRFGIVTPDLRKLRGLYDSILNDYETSQNALKYQQNLLSYNEKFLTNYKIKNYELKGVASVHATVSKAKHATALGYVLRRMKNVNKHKGAIVLYYASKNEIASEENDKWIDDMIETIKHLNLDIIVDVLPAFADE